MFFTKSFSGGIYPPSHKKLTENSGIEDAALPSKIVVLSPSIVKKGEKVKVGQKIAAAGQIPVHSSVSGKVLSVDPIVIETDGKQDVDGSIKPYPVLQKLTIGEIIGAVKKAGIGSGLQSAFEKKVKVLIINGAETEPYFTSAYRLMLEDVFNIAYGIDVCKKALGLKKAYVGIGEDKPIAISYLTKKLNYVDIVRLKAKYPQDAGKILIKAVLGASAADVLVLDVSTSAQIAKTLKTGMPLVDKVITVTGQKLRRPANLKVRIGTLFRDIISQCGGVEGEIGEIVCGGSMAGRAASLDTPVDRDTAGIVVFSKKELEPKQEEEICIKCGRCTDVCPFDLTPIRLMEEPTSGKIGDCIECGACSYICPSRRERRR